MTILRIMAPLVGLWILITGVWLVPAMTESAASGEWVSWGPLLYTGMTVGLSLGLLGWYFWYVLVADAWAHLKRHHREVDHDRS